MFLILISRGFISNFTWKSLQSYCSDKNMKSKATYLALQGLTGSFLCRADWRLPSPTMPIVHFFLVKSSSLPGQKPMGLFPASEGRLHRRYWLATRAACVIWKTGIGECLWGGGNQWWWGSQAVSRAHARTPHANTLLRRAQANSCGWLAFYFPYSGRSTLTKEISAIKE